MKKLFFSIIFILISSFVFSQEICDNGIDDDGDGLIDLNDTTDCQCTGQGTPINIPSLIPNPSFEDNTCCPTTYGMAGQTNDGLGCADAWQQAGGATSDYFNECGWNGASTSLPFPDGNAAVGMFSFDGWCEFVGGCLLSPTNAGDDYNLTFSLGFDNMTSAVVSCGSPTATSPPINFTLYGTPDCNDIPFSGYTCPIGQGSWIELGYVTIDPMTIFESWEEVTIDFNTTMDIAGFALGPPCDLPSTGYTGYSSSCAPYFLVDNLIMNETAAFNSNLSTDTTGNPCSVLTLNAHADTLGSFQWYYEGVAMAGETDSILDITGNAYPAGTYQVVFDYGVDCLVGEESFISTPATVIVSNDTTICEGETVIITASGCNTYAWDQSLGSGASHTVTPSTTTTYAVVGTNIEGCTDNDAITITVIPNPTSDFTVTNPACFGDISTITYTGNASTTATYTWGFDTGNIVSGSGQGPYQIDWAIANTYNITLQVANGNCVSPITTHTVTNPILVQITASNDTSICEGQTAIISASGNALNYMWNQGAGVGATQTVTPTTTTTYTVMGTDANSCYDTDEVTVTVIPNPNADFIFTDIPCFGDNSTVTYTGNAPASAVYNWTFTSGSIVSGSGQGPFVANWANTGTFAISLQVSNGTCVSPLNTQNIFIPEELNATTNGTDLICHNDISTGSVSVTATGGTPAYNYLWSNQNTSQSQSGIPAGIYTVSVTDDNGCEVIRTVTISEPSQLHVSVPADFYMCVNPSEDIQSSVTGGVGNYTYEWNNSQHTQNITVSPIVETTYILTVTDGNGCTASDEIIVMIHPPLVINAYSDLDTVCPGDPVLLDIDITGGSGYPYTIYLDGSIVNPPTIVYPSGNQAYTFVVEDNCANTAQDIVQILNYEKPPLSFTSDKLRGCVPLEIQFNETSNCNNCSYTWDFGDNDGISYSYNNHPIHVFENAGIFDISCSVINEDGCKNSLVIYHMIEAYPKPDANFTAIPDVAPIINPIIDFINYSEGGVDYFWSFGDGDSSMLVSPHHVYDEVGYYDVQLVVISEHGCVDTARYTVRIKDIYTFYAPTAFSPDGDGVNDNFSVFGTGIDLDNFNLKVYDRWGEIIWETNDIFETWDGKVKKHGKVAQNGMYTWRCVFLDFTGVEHEETGPITIIK